MSGEIKIEGNLNKPIKSNTIRFILIGTFIILSSLLLFDYIYHIMTGKDSILFESSDAENLTPINQRDNNITNVYNAPVTNQVVPIKSDSIDDKNANKTPKEENTNSTTINVTSNNQQDGQTAHTINNNR